MFLEQTSLELESSGSCETIGAAITLLQGIGRKRIIVGDSPGFVINRVLTPGC